MISLALQKDLQRILLSASEQRHEYLTLEHLLLGLIDKNESVIECLVACKADLDVLEQELTNYIAKNVATIQNASHVPQHTRGFDRTIQRAVFHVQSGATPRLVEGADLLVSMFAENDVYAVYLLKKQGITRLELTQYLSHGNQALSENDDDVQTPNDKPKNTSESALLQYTQNLNEKARLGNTDPLIGRHAEIERTAQILCRRRKNNPLLVGDPGVGKTSIAEGLAWLIVNDKAPKPLQDCEIYALDIGGLIAGTKFRGDFEKRIKALLDELKSTPNVILFIDEIHMIIGAGSSMNSTMDVSNLLKPALANGSLRCIGSTTFVEYRQVFEKDHSLARRFQKIDVNEPGIDDTIAILHGLKLHYEQFHRVKYSDNALKTAVHLSVKHIHERFLPDKAIDVIDEAGAFVRLQNNATGIELDKTIIDKTIELDKTEQMPMIDTADIEKIIAKIARIPEKTVSSDDKENLKNLEENLKHLVFGQDDAIKTLVDAIKLSRAGLKPDNKPIGSFMFAGPTGVGKTEVSRQLANLLGIELLRFDMSEYMESHTASRLIGAPPGYVGFDQGGLLTEKINQFPYCVLLLDEIEKAHPDVFNLLLQVMDHGTLTDNNGRTSSFKQVILIMTTNVGADSISRASMGFTEQDHSRDNSEAIKRVFSPEFRNRLDAIVHFNPLDMLVIDSVVDKFLTELQAQLDDKQIILEVDDTVRAYLANKGYDRLMGARPMSRLIQDEIKKPLAEMILFGDLANGGIVELVMTNHDEGSNDIQRDNTQHDSTQRIDMKVVKKNAKPMTQADNVV
ncbi:ATPase AAA-2 [Moraxella macacae 0408225]|uniref:ATPase AAA-2 n=1 Tax=Moraxella macacae 0408225 TaxID=1230338 RepID=L2F6Q7_9GAMM|nr:ATP-dependent Clp protease ATP-binding subunit ClpA [Moraxella macacae]ELA08565.1 ATPase AAA-2 [Moraxella macacae 0408225]